MMVPPGRLIDGAVETLREEVLPALGSRFARSRLHAVLDVLCNLRDAVEPRSDLIQAEIESLERALHQCRERLEERGATAAAMRVAEVLGAAPAEPPGARARELRAALVVGLEAAALAGPAGDRARSALLRHLAAQALRDTQHLQTARLERISGASPRPSGASPRPSGASPRPSGG